MILMQVLYVFLLLVLFIEIQFELYAGAAVTFLILLGFTIYRGSVLFGG